MAERDVTNNSPPLDLKDRLKNTYDIIAEKYNIWAVRDTSIRMKYLDVLLPHLDPSAEEKHILELGCGSGNPVLKKLASLNNTQVTANDMSPVQIQFAKQNFAEEEKAGKVKLIEGDMMTLEFANASFDAIVGMYSLIHLPASEQRTMFSRIAKWLKPGGCMLANFSEEEMAHSIQENWMHEKGWTYWSGLGVQGTMDAIKHVGLEIEFHDVSVDVADANFLWILARKAA
jgi:ubiquinone/menaquinone biosynthesis C-methylase UbiE